MEAVCDRCGGVATYGAEGVRTRCKKHALADMTFVRVQPQCAECGRRPSFGVDEGKATHCAAHKKPGMTDVMHKRCDECKDYYVWKRLPLGAPKLCLGCFERAYPDHPHIKRRKTKETFFYHHLRAALPDVPIRWDQAVPNTCGIRRRPDYYIEGVYRDLAGECDEYDHAAPAYTTTCEEARINELVTANGDNRPLHMFRFNPDATPKPVRVNVRTGLASKGPGFDALLTALVDGTREWLAWDATTPVDVSEPLFRVEWVGRDDDAEKEAEAETGGA